MSAAKELIVVFIARKKKTYLQVVEQWSQYSNMAPRLSGQNCKFLKFLLSLNSQKRLGYKENNTKYRCLS